MRIKEKFVKFKKVLASVELDVVYKLLAVITALCLVFAFILTRNERERIEKNSAKKDICVSVKGEVKKPGVYKIKYDSRIKDLVSAAGGYTDNADFEKINPAEIVIDAEEIYIPKKPDTSVKGLININTATAEQLQELPGIGAAYAQRIIDYRNNYGSFRSIDCIMNVNGIGESKFEKIKGLITVQ